MVLVILRQIYNSHTSQTLYRNFQNFLQKLSEDRWNRNLRQVNRAIEEVVATDDLQFVLARESGGEYQ